MTKDALILAIDEICQAGIKANREADYLAALVDIAELIEKALF